MKYMHLEQKESVYILTLTNGAEGNCISADVLSEFAAVIDEVETNQNDAALIIQSSDEKTFSHGLNLPWVMTQDSMAVQKFVYAFENILIRLSLLNLPVVIAINGNCYAGGAILACTGDFRVMRADRGRFCFPEISLKLPFTDDMYPILKNLPNAQAVWEMTLTGVAYGGKDCLKRQIVDQISAPQSLFNDAFARAKDLATKNRKTYTAIKRGLRSEIVTLARSRELLVG
jgi:enoyl-CoA hydratase/carnithine racemase